MIIIIIVVVHFCIHNRVLAAMPVILRTVAITIVLKLALRSMATN